MPYLSTNNKFRKMQNATTPIIMKPKVYLYSSSGTQSVKSSNSIEETITKNSFIMEMRCSCLLSSALERPV